MGKTALVWGANGISGIATIEALLERPASDISTVIAASRRPPLIPFKDDRVKFVSVDLLSNDVEQIAGKLNEVGADKTEIVFAYAYIEKSDPHELETVNMELLQKSLDSTVTVAGKNVKHVVLQTG